MKNDDRGIASVEFAMIAPLLLTLVGGIFEYGRILAAEQATRDIIDGAVRAGVVQILSSDAVQSIITDGMSNVPAVSAFTVDITDGTTLGVTVTGTYDLVFGGFLPPSLLTFQVSTQLHR